MGLKAISSSSSSGGGTIASTTNLLIGDGAGNASAAGAGNITSASANALTVGRLGSTTPALQVDASTATSVTGVQIKSAAAGGGVTITAISSATDESMTISAKGFSGLNVNNGGGFVNIQSSTIVINANGLTNFTYNFRNGSNVPYQFNGNTDSGLTASTNVPSMDMNFAQVKTHDAGALALQYDVRIRPSTHAFATLSSAATVAGLVIDGAPIAGTNATFTNTSTIFSLGNNVGTSSINSYALNLTANTGGTNNYIASLNGSAGEVQRIRTDGQVVFLNTVTTTGTTGNQTINKPSGTVNIAAAGTTVTVTNSLCALTSLVFAVVRTNDTTAIIKNIVPAAGSFVVNLNAATTAEVSIGWFIIN